MLHSFIFSEESLGSEDHSPCSPIASSLSSLSDELGSASYPSPLDKNLRESAHKNWEAIEESIIHWFEGKSIRRGEPTTLEEEFSVGQRRAIRLTDKSERVSPPSQLAARKLSARIRILI